MKPRDDQLKIKTQTEIKLKEKTKKKTKNKTKPKKEYQVKNDFLTCFISSINYKIDSYMGFLNFYYH